MKHKQVVGFSLAFLLYLCIPILFLIPFEQKNETVSYEKESTLTVWGWDKSIEEAFEQYQLSHPNVHMNFVYVSSQDYVSRLKLALAASEPLPDICILSSNYRKEFLSMDIWEKLEEDPYALERSFLLEHSINGVTDQDGDIVAVPYELSAAGVAFRNSLAKKVIGTDNPSQVSVIFHSWADILSKGLRIKQEYGDDFYMFTGLEDAATILYGQTSQAYIMDNTLIEPQRFFNYFKVLTSLRDNQLADSIQQWSPEWYNSFLVETYFFYPSALWLTEQGVFGLGEGDEWSYTVPPSGSFDWGGTAWAIPKTSKNKELAWDFTKTMLLSQAGAIYNKEKANGVFINYKPAYDQENYCNMYHMDFGNQNIGRFYFENILPSMNMRPLSQYDSRVKSAYLFVVNVIQNDREINAHEAYDLLIKLIQESIPDITLE